MRKALSLAILASLLTFSLRSRADQIYPIDPGSGSVPDRGSQARLGNLIDPGSGTGGVTITNINGVPLTIVLSTEVTTTLSKLAYNAETQIYSGTIEIKNVSDHQINAPANGFFNILFESLPAGVTLVNAAKGQFNESPSLIMPKLISLAPGQSSVADVQFKSLSSDSITFTPVIYLGNLSGGFHIEIPNKTKENPNR